jgi:hypothetical protein
VLRALQDADDGTGPLYNARSRTSLCAGAARAVQNLRPWAA